MNPAQVKEALASIEAGCADDENAHYMEDGLHQSVLRSIADGTCTDPGECARLALQSNDIKFSRWYA